MVQFLASQGTYIVVHKSYIQTDRACRYTSLHYVVVCNYISLKHIFTQPVGSLMSSSVSDWLSIRSTSHWRCDSSLMARYSWVKACGSSDVWSSVTSSRHCCCGLLLVICRARTLSSPMTASCDKKSMMLAGLMLVTTVWCSLWNLSFNVSFDSTQLNSN